MSSIKVLVADDDKLNRMMVSKLLSKMGAECSEAENGEMALEMALVGGYSLILLDYNMPGYSGAECAVQIRSHYAELGEKLPMLVCVSADEDLGEEEVFDDFLPKPFKVNKISDILARVKEA